MKKVSGKDLNTENVLYLFNLFIYLIMYIEWATLIHNAQTDMETCCIPMIPTVYLERFTFLHFKDKDMAGPQHTGIHYHKKYGRTPK